jgi:hypothetical protein
MASGKVRQVAQLPLDPARVRIWPGNARSSAPLTEDSCRGLIDSIIAKGGQKVPPVGRRIEGDREHAPALVDQLAARLQLFRKTRASVFPGKSNRGSSFGSEKGKMIRQARSNRSKPRRRRVAADRRRHEITASAAPNCTADTSGRH